MKGSVTFVEMNDVVTNELKNRIIQLIVSYLVALSCVLRRSIDK